MVAGSAASVTTIAAAVGAGLVPARDAGDHEGRPYAVPAPAQAQAAADPVHAAIAAHARAYAAYAAQLEADAYDDVALEKICKVEWKAAAALAATVPPTLAGAAAALAHVRLLHERDGHPALDDFQCYVFIASTETALRALSGGSGVGSPSSSSSEPDSK